MEGKKNNNGHGKRATEMTRGQHLRGHGKQGGGKLRVGFSLSMFVNEFTNKQFLPQFNAGLRQGEMH